MYDGERIERRHERRSLGSQTRQYSAIMWTIRWGWSGGGIWRFFNARNNLMAELAKFAKHATILKVEFAWLHSKGARGVLLVCDGAPGRCEGEFVRLGREIYCSK